MNTCGGGAVYELLTLTVTNNRSSWVQIPRRHHMNEALWRGQTSACMNLSYREVTPRLKDFEHEKVSLKWSELREVINCTAWSALTVKDLHNSADQLPRLHWLWLPQRIRIMDNWSPASIWMTSTAITLRKIASIMARPSGVKMKHRIWHK